MQMFLVTKNKKHDMFRFVCYSCHSFVVAITTININGLPLLTV